MKPSILLGVISLLTLLVSFTCSDQFANCPENVPYGPAIISADKPVRLRASVYSASCVGGCRIGRANFIGLIMPGERFDLRGPRATLNEYGEYEIDTSFYEGTPIYVLDTVLSDTGLVLRRQAHDTVVETISFDSVIFPDDGSTIDAGSIIFFRLDTGTYYPHEYFRDDSTRWLNVSEIEQPEKQAMCYNCLFFNAGQTGGLFCIEILTEYGGQIRHGPYFRRRSDGTVVETGIYFLGTKFPDDTITYRDIPALEAYDPPLPPTP